MRAATRTGSVLLAQPNQRLSEGLRDWLQTDFEGVFVVADRASLIEGVCKLQPTLVLIDLALAEGQLGSLLAQLLGQAPRSRLLVLSDYDDAGVDAVALAAGAHGVVRKASLAADLLPAVDAVLAGQRFTGAGRAH